VSGAYPLAFRPAKVEMTGVSPTFVSTPHSLKAQRRSRGAHRWRLKYIYGPMVRAEYSPIVGFLDEQLGQFEKFTTVIAGKENPLGGVSGATQVDGAQAAGVLSVNLKNLPATINGVFKAFDLITFAGHLKVYEVTRDANSDGAGKATVFIMTPLFTAVANTEAVTWQNVAMKVARASDTFDRSWKGGLVCPGFEVEMNEDPYP
jgi:hypothetical protein